MRKQAVAREGRLPNLIIAGTVKSGTTSLFTYLVKHPQICGSDVKETCYFLPLRYGGSCPDLGDYRKHFRQCGNARYALESTPGYFEGGESLARAIDDTLEGALIIIVLREPVDRLYSFFRYAKAQVNLAEETSLGQYISECLALPMSERIKQENDVFWGVDGGRYINYLPQWFDVFSSERIRVVFFDDVLNDCVTLLKGIADWLGVCGAEFERAVVEIENKTLHYRVAWLQKASIRLNKKLEPFLRRTPSLRRVIRAFYYRLNAKPFKEDVDEQVWARARMLYQSDNRSLAAFLRAQGYRNLPRWLQTECL